MLARTSLSILLLAFTASLCLVASTEFSNLSERDQLKHFQAFTKAHNKNYKDAAEAQTRFQNFKASLQRIDELNAQDPNGAKFGITKFADLTAEEFRRHYLSSKTYFEVKEVDPTLYTNPPKIDWREKGAVTAVKDQGQCGSCWAFSATETIESQWILAGKAKAKKFALSPQQMVDCDTTSEGCGGGWMNNAFEYIINAGGQESETTYPYTAEDGRCKFNKTAVVAKISGFENVTETEAALGEAVATVGPLSIAVEAEAWQYYTTGVMSAVQCGYTGSLDHGVQVVGYDTTAPVPYWIVRNTWSTDWGNEGYIYLAMGANTCGLTVAASYAKV